MPLNAKIVAENSKSLITLQIEAFKKYAYIPNPSIKRDALKRASYVKR